MHKADIGEGPPQNIIVVPHHKVSTDTDNANVNRLVFPGPSYALADVEMKQEDNGTYALYCTKDFAFGERVYDFWRCDWPFGGRDPIGMVASTKLKENDPTEGTTVRLVPTECAAKKDRSGHFQFSGWDLLTQHSCEPNLTYNDIHEDEDDNWQGAYATRDIKKGEKLTIDYNSVLWDRSDSKNADECKCGAGKCVGTMMGFKVCKFKNITLEYTQNRYSIQVYHGTHSIVL
jgi:hypothetical protein